MNPTEFAPSEPPPGSRRYVYDGDLSRAVRVALATSRPLLLRGAPGSGKTTLARDVARQLGRAYYQQVVTSRTEARDLEWTFDAVRRLADAQLRGDRGRVARLANYVDPQVLWWGFDPVSAARRGGASVGAGSDPGDSFGEAPSPTRPTVVLIDEIDKAEPEVANDLLEPFDVGGFTVAETRFPVTRRRDVFLVVTTNDERDLPGAFLRRCIVHEIRRPGAEVLAAIARAHFDDTVARDTALAVAQRLDALAAQARARRLREPGVAEFLDALRACRDLRVAPGSDEWEPVTRLALWKHRRADDGGDAP